MWSYASRRVIGSAVPPNPRGTIYFWIVRIVFASAIVHVDWLKEHYTLPALAPAIWIPDRTGIIVCAHTLITKPEVERKLLQRLRKKAEVYALNFSPEGEPSGDAGRKIDVDAIVELYEHYIIPLTKEVEVRLLFCSLTRLA